MPSSSKIVFALHGFLGLQDDWELIPDLLPLGWRLRTVNLWASSNCDLETWAQHFCESVKLNFPESEAKILVGYSLGGRLALHALANSPELFDGAVIISANAGLLTDDERALRRESDARWASRFLTDDWSSLMTAWNSQGVFEKPSVRELGSIAVSRDERDFDRKALSASLNSWSLGSQKDLRPALSQLKLPIDYITGAADQKFTQLTKDLVSHKALGEREHVTIANSGHRVPWDAPSQFRVALAKFLSRW